MSSWRNASSRNPMSHEGEVPEAEVTAAAVRDLEADLPSIEAEFRWCEGVGPVDGADAEDPFGGEGCRRGGL
eukprot:6596015-Pyramimonas_sp.AAC.1